MICCLDLEGVLIPEIWINVARKTGIKALEITTRDEPDYDKLMHYRLKILKKEGIRLRDILILQKNIVFQFYRPQKWPQKLQTVII